MDPRLVVMAVGYSLGIALTVGLGFFVWIRAKRNVLSTIFLLMNLSIAAVEASIVGVSAFRSDTLANIASLLNIANIGIVVFMAHWSLEVVGKARARRLPLFLIYAGGIFLFLFFLIKPGAFLLPPVPKLYLYHYFEPALWYTIMRGYFTIVTVYFLYELFSAYRAARDNSVRNRLWYVFSGILFGMITGHIALPLVYDIPIDPLLSFLFPLYTIPFAYAVIHYELMDIKIVARRALFYAMAVALLSALLGIVGFANELLREAYPAFPRSVVPIAVALLASALGFSVWFRLREGETLKYEFITVVTHKFRTPLTEIKWTIESLRGGGEIPAHISEGLCVIGRATTALVELTDTLVRTTESEDTGRAYRFESVSLQETARSALARMQPQIGEKRLHVLPSLPAIPVLARADRELLALVFETILENAVAYTPRGGSVSLAVSETDGKAVCAVSDSGIGIARDELPRMFEKFYRGAGARRLFTEGMGVGLFIAKQIIDRHGGSITASSDGAGKGATFTVSLPRV